MTADVLATRRRVQKLQSARPRMYLRLDGPVAKEGLDAKESCQLFRLPTE